MADAVFSSSWRILEPHGCALCPCPVKARVRTFRAGSRGSTGCDGAGELECVPSGCRRVAVVGIDANEPATVEVDGFVFGGLVDGDEGIDAVPGNGGCCPRAMW